MVSDSHRHNDGKTVFLIIGWHDLCGGQLILERELDFF